MKIFKASLLLVVLGALVSVGMAQGPGMKGPGGMRGGPGGMRGKPGDRMKKMLDGLNLTPAQKKKTDAIVDEGTAKVMKLLPPGGGRPGPDFREKMKPIHDAEIAKLMKVLTPAQGKKLKDMEAAMRARFMGRGGAGGHMGAPGKSGAGAPPKP
jgi:Spy/CpxP family protein refolding chaperone